MFLLVFAVPAVLVVVLGYVVGYGLQSWIGGLLDAALGTSLAEDAEPAGWITGALLLLAWCSRWFGGGAGAARTLP